MQGMKLVKTKKRELGVGFWIFLTSLIRAGRFTFHDSPLTIHLFHDFYDSRFYCKLVNKLKTSLQKQ